MTNDHKKDAKGKSYKGKNSITKGIYREIEILDRHIKVLKEVIENEPIGIKKLAKNLGLSFYMTRYSLSVLEKKGLIKPSPAGAITTEKTKIFMQEVSEDLDNVIKEIRSIRKDLCQ
ncbi:MAG TPA: winged helix-turn-helix transcriptional regulator [Halobacteria archaeon]|jgi:predicted transcriptional regulator|nr:winged helix-turn-helix transcriptional regulator [Halobacteria archaeon]